MKKFLIFLLAVFFVTPTMAFADDPKVLTLNAEATNNTIGYTGTTEDGSHAVMCKLYNSNDKEIDILSVAVGNNAFEGNFTVTATGEYKVTCANYSGGSIKEANVTVTQMAAPVEHTVQFETNCEATIAEAKVEHNKYLAEPNKPENGNYVFAGWYEDATLLVKFDFDKKITDDLKLYAKWKNPSVPVHTIFFGEGGTYIVNFEIDEDYDDEQGPMEAPINASGVYFVPDGKTMTLTAIPAEGYTFKGWYEGNVNAQTPEEWPTDTLISSNSVYTFTPEGNPYIVPVFEDHRIHKIEFVTNCDDELEYAEVEHGGLLEPPRPLNNDGSTFEGWYEDETLLVEFDFNKQINDDLTLYAKWKEKGTTYTVNDDNGNSISFKEEEGRNYSLEIIDIMTLTDEQLAEYERTREMYEEVKSALTEAVKEEGTLVAFYDIIVNDANNGDKHNGPFNIKIKMTDEMKEFNSFKLLYIDINDNFKIEKTVVLKVENGYLVGTLPHLSNYVLVGNNVSNPQTLDNIYIWIITLFISVIGLSITTKKIKKSMTK